MIAVKSIITFKLLYLTKIAGTNPHNSYADTLEWQALYIREYKTSIVPTKPPTIKEAITWLGKLEGFLNRKSDKFPGSMSLWHGYENLK